MSLWPVSPTSNVKLTGGTTGQYLQTDGGDFREISDVEV